MVVPRHHGARGLVDHGVGGGHAGQFRHRLRSTEAGKLGRVPLDKFQRVLVAILRTFFSFPSLTGPLNKLECLFQSSIKFEGRSLPAINSGRLGP